MIRSNTKSNETGVRFTALQLAPSPHLGKSVLEYAAGKLSGAFLEWRDILALFLLP